MRVDVCYGILTGTSRLQGFCKAARTMLCAMVTKLSILYEFANFYKKIEKKILKKNISHGLTYRSMDLECNYAVHAQDHHLCRDCGLSLIIGSSGKCLIIIVGGGSAGSVLSANSNSK